MAAHTITLSVLFDVEKEYPTQEAKAHSGLADAEDTVKVPNLSWPLIQRKLEEKLTACFDLDLIDLCVGAWKKYDEIREFADSRKHPDGEENEVALLEHEFTSTHHPALEVRVDNEKVGTVPFELNISLKLEGADLTIKAGAITKVRLGKCHGEASLALKSKELLSFKSKNVPLSEAFILPEPISVRDD
jgi:hypothetical protein